MTKFIHLIIISISISLASCIEVAKNVEMDNVEPKLVVQSYLCPTDTVISLILTMSKPIYGVNVNQYDYSNVENATVKISSSNKSCILTYNPNYKAYFTQKDELKIQPGEIYSLSITTPDGKSIQSTCKIPPLPEISIYLSGFDSVQNPNGTEYTKFFKLVNNSSEEKYFCINRFRKFYDPWLNDTSSNFEPFLIQINPKKSGMFSFKNFHSLDIPNPEIFFDDSLLVYQVDESYFKYHQTVLNGNNDGNPFTEPTIIYSNITNGLGVFCGYNKQYIKVIK